MFTVMLLQEFSANPRGDGTTFGSDHHTIASRDTIAGHQDIAAPETHIVDGPPKQHPFKHISNITFIEEGKS